jgi:putative restriction endonuclease
MKPDNQYRHAAFNWLNNQVDIHSDVFPRDLLTEGFYHNGERITLLGPQGIWKPKVFELPLSITTVISGPYRDSFSEDGYLLYKYRGTDPGHRDNVGLREARRIQVPLIYFNNVIKGKYHAIWPVFIIDDDPTTLTFKVAADDEKHLHLDNDFEYSSMEDSIVEQTRRSYLTATVKQRLHQRSFRERVLQAYHEQCSLCRLKHRELLDAAHIIPDSDPGGEPVVSNGLSLCKLHHAAFDRNIIGISPDYIIEIRNDILEETDGPMLKHGLQGLHENKIILPGKKHLHPDRDRLETRYKIFKEAG